MYHLLIMEKASTILYLLLLSFLPAFSQVSSIRVTPSPMDIIQEQDSVDQAQLRVQYHVEFRATKEDCFLSESMQALDIGNCIVKFFENSWTYAFSHLPKEIQERSKWNSDTLMLASSMAREKSSKYKKDLENKEKENNVTQEKIELDIDDKKEKDDNKNVVKENPDKNFVYSRKYKYKPHQYTTNTFNVTKNVPNNNTNINNGNKETKYQNETFKPNYRIYQKRQIITTKKEIHENNPIKNKTELIDNEEYNNNINRAPKKEIEVRKKIIFSKKINPPVNSIVHGQSPTSKPSINNPEKNSKNEEIKFKKTTQPYSSANNNTKKKNIRLNMFSGENDIFKETENELNKRNKNNIYANYMKNKNTTKNYQRPNRTQNISELVEDLEKIEQYSVNTYLKNDLLEIYGNINEEFKNFKNDVFNSNLNDFEENMAVFDNKNSIRKKYKYNVKDLCKGKTTTDDIFRKYTKRAINIEKKEGFYNKK